MLRTASSLPLAGLLTLGFDPTRFQMKPPACYRATWQLPEPDSHRQATTSLRTANHLQRQPPAPLDARKMEVNALGRGLMIAQDSGNRTQASALAPFLARFAAEQGGTVAAFDHLTLAIRNYHNAGETGSIRVPLAVLAVLFDRLGHYEPAATIAGFAL